MKKPMSAKDRRNRSLQKYNKRVVQICKKTNKFIEKYHSIRYASDANNIDRSSLKRAMRSIRFSAGGFRWMLFEEWVIKVKELNECLFRDLDIKVDIDIKINYYSQRIKESFILTAPG